MPSSYCVSPSGSTAVGLAATSRFDVAFWRQWPGVPAPLLNWGSDGSQAMSPAAPITGSGTGVDAGDGVGVAVAIWAWAGAAQSANAAAASAAPKRRDIALHNTGRRGLSRPPCPSVTCRTLAAQAAGEATGQRRPALRRRAADQLAAQVQVAVAAREVDELEAGARVLDQELLVGQGVDARAHGLGEVDRQRADERRLVRLAVLPDRGREVVAADPAAPAHLGQHPDQVDRDAAQRVVAVHVGEVQRAVGDLVDHLGRGPAQYDPLGRPGLRLVHRLPEVALEHVV